MADAAAVQAMEALHSCRCCLRRPPDKGLKTLYENVGKTENYWDMLKECFNIHLNVGNDECGICEVCVARLRDATEFKMQVQQSQVELKALLEKALQEKDKKPSLIKVELVEEDPNVEEVMIQDDGPVKSEMGDGDIVSSLLSSEESSDVESVTSESEHSNSPFNRQKRLKTLALQANLAKHMERLKTIALEANLAKRMALHVKGSQKKILSSGDSSDAESLVSECEDNNSPFTCQECQKTFDLEDSLTEHMAVHAIGSVATETKTLLSGEVSDAESVISESQDNNSPFKCQECQKTFDLEDSLTEHMAVHAIGSVATETKTLSSGDSSDAESVISESVDNNSPFKCPECQKTFDLEDSLTKHVAVHVEGSAATEMKEHTCEVCCEIFESFADLTKHMDIHDGPPKVLENEVSLGVHMRTHTGEIPYSCEVCDKNFRHKHRLKEHIMRYHRVDMFLCQRCPKQFIALAELKEHELVHTEERTDSCENTCNICSQTFEQKADLTNHMEIHNQHVAEGGLRKKISTTKESGVKEIRFSCEVCNRKFKHNHQLDQHMKSHQREDQRQIFRQFAEQSHLKEHELENKTKTPYVCENKCDFCCQSFKLKTDLTKHMEIHKETKDFRCGLCKKVLANKDSLKAHMSTHTGQKPYSCQVCSMKFGRKQHLKRHHMKTHKGKCLFFCQICPKQFTEQTEWKKHELVHAEKLTQTYMCETCKKGFGSNIHLQIHMLEHKKHTCQICEEKFKYKSLLDTHAMTHIDKSHTCEICKAKFKHKRHLMTHLNTHIENRQYFTCNVCTEQFTNRSSLHTHKRLHTKPYSCDVCKKQFERKASLHIHKLTRHTGENCNSCDVCGKQFKHKKDLNNHILRLHTGQKLCSCVICKKQFSSKRVLYTHMKFHSGEKPHVCNICQKSFVVRTGLRAHKLIHTGEKPFTCDVCGKAFLTKDRLNKHLVIHYMTD